MNIYIHIYKQITTKTKLKVVNNFIKEEKYLEELEFEDSTMIKRRLSTIK